MCGLGVHSGLIMPPHWILKLPSRGRVQSSFRYSREWEEVTTTIELETKVHSKIRLAECINSVLNVKVVVAAFNQEKALVGPFSVITIGWNFFKH